MIDILSRKDRAVLQANLKPATKAIGTETIAMFMQLNYTHLCATRITSVHAVNTIITAILQVLILSAVHVHFNPPSHLTCWRQFSCVLVNWCQKALKMSISSKEIKFAIAAIFLHEKM